MARPVRSQPPPALAGIRMRYRWWGDGAGLPRRRWQAQGGQRSSGQRLSGTLCGPCSWLVVQRRTPAVSPNRGPARSPRSACMSRRSRLVGRPCCKASAGSGAIRRDSAASLSLRGPTRAVSSYSRRQPEPARARQTAPDDHGALASGPGGVPGCRRSSLLWMAWHALPLTSTRPLSISSLDSPRVL